MIAISPGSSWEASLWERSLIAISPALGTKIQIAIMDRSYTTRSHLP